MENRQNDLERLWITQAEAYESKFEFEQAIPFQKKLVAQRQRRFPFDIYAVRQPTLYLAMDEQLSKLDPVQLDQYREAKKIYEKAMSVADFPQAAQGLLDASEKFNELLGQKNPSYLKCLEKLAPVQLAMGNNQAALSTVEKARPLLVELYGDSPFVTANLRIAANILQTQEKSTEAIQSQREIVAMNERLIKNVSVASELALARSQLGEMVTVHGLRP